MKDLDPRTLRWVVSSQRARMRRNAHFWQNVNWVHMESLLGRLTDEARAIEKRRAKKGKTK